ncbi:hypothetical protein V5799_032318 [Amblyomma americanum]|uniref:Alpha 1,4-glycosyltransferase domain-containing protein n=1 Tax=Amblyomma americanum TaxID=6943 RepID=A0AAQ4DRI8_AMBAM
MAEERPTGVGETGARRQTSEKHKNIAPVPYSRAAQAVARRLVPHHPHFLTGASESQRSRTEYQHAQQSLELIQHLNKGKFSPIMNCSMNRAIKVVGLGALFLVLFALINITDPPIHSRLSPSTETTAGTFVPRKTANFSRIFFLETGGRREITARMACAVESAARLHPSWTVHLLSVTDGHSRSEISGPFADVLRAIPNVVVSTITPLEEFQGTPLEPWYRSGVLNRSAYPVEHLADALRLAVIYKRGGVYLDSDVVMLRPLDMLPSFVSQSPAISAPRLEKGDSVSNGFLAFHRGEPFLLELMNRVVKAYIPQAWASIGPLLLRSVTLEYCGKRSVKELVGRWCRSGEDFMCGAPHNSSFSDIFFLETGGRGIITARMACAVESAARAHPNWTVHLLSVDGDGHATNDSSAPFVNLLGSIQNVVLSDIEPLEEFEGTPLGAWYRSGALNNSSYPVEHLADALRLAVLYNRGGVYLDIDVVVMRPLDCLPSFVCQSPAWRGDLVSNGFLGFHRGDPFLLKLMNHTSRAYQPNKWSSIGPRLLRDVTLAYCGKRSVKELVGRRCGADADFTGVNLP